MKLIGERKENVSIGTSEAPGVSLTDDELDKVAGGISAYPADPAHRDRPGGISMPEPR